MLNYQRVNTLMFPLETEVILPTLLTSHPDHPTYHPTIPSMYHPSQYHPKTKKTGFRPHFPHPNCHKFGMTIPLSIIDPKNSQFQMETELLTPLLAGSLRFQKIVYFSIDTT